MAHFDDILNLNDKFIDAIGNIEFAFSMCEEALHLGMYTCFHMNLMFLSILSIYLTIYELEFLLDMPIGSKEWFQ